MRKTGENGYLTVYMALTLAVLLSLCLTMVEGARRSAMRMQAEVITYSSMKSVLAEYNRELMKQYNIFAIDSSYGTAVSGADMISSHFSHYVGMNYEYDTSLFSMNNRDFIGTHPESASVDGVVYLTDEEGRIFRECAINAIKDDFGIVVAEQVISWASSSQIIAADALNVSSDMNEKDMDVSGAAAAERSRRQAKRAQEESDYANACSEAEARGEPKPSPPDYTEVPDEYRSPVSGVANTANVGILGLVLDDSDNLSMRTLDLNGVISGRMNAGKINTGNLMYLSEDEVLGEEALNKAVFGEYLISYMGCYGSTCDKDAMWYQIEYIISGKGTDVENLNHVVCLIMAIRSGLNLLYLESDNEKKSQAELLASGICTACMIPSMSQALTQAILSAWAVAEARYDTRTLLMGGRLDLLKNKENWHTDLGSALAGTVSGVEKSSKTGLSYKDYLRLFLFMSDTEKITKRAMDMVESDIRLTGGNSLFRMDACVEMIECSVEVTGRNGSRSEIRRKLKYA